MKIAFCCIVKDDTELYKLKNCINSVKVIPIISSINITANGEKTENIEQYCKENNFNYSYLKWTKDYSAQRNFNFNSVQENVDYILWLDSDDILVGGENLEKVANLSKKRGLDFLFLTYWYGCEFTESGNLKKVELHHQRERLIKPGSIIWKKRIHETPVDIDGRKTKYSSIKYLPGDKHEYKIAVMHTEATRDSKERNNERNQRNLEILRLELADERVMGEADPRTILYLMKILVEVPTDENIQECIALGEEYLKSSGWNEERSTCYGIIGRCFAQINRLDAAEDMFLEAIKEFPYNKVMFLRLSQVYLVKKDYKKSEFWLNHAINLDVEKETSGTTNLLEEQYLENLIQRELSHLYHKKLKKAYEYAQKTYQLTGEEHDKQREDLLYDLKRFNDGSKHLDKLINYLDEIKNFDAIRSTLKAVAEIFYNLPFFSRLVKKYSPPRIWGDDEICYYANFDGNHFEKWDGNSLSKGIGGSETAVIRLSEEWVKLGYKVTVYGDPMEPCTINGVRYLPYHMFNNKDYFNIFIQWRSNHMCESVVARQFYVDLHDVWNDFDFIHKTGVDSIFVKSKYHRSLSERLPDNAFSIISNGIDE